MGGQKRELVYFRSSYTGVGLLSRLVLRPLDACTSQDLLHLIVPYTEQPHSV